MNNIDRQYKELLEHIIRFGVNKQDRTGIGTKSIFGWQIRHNMKEGFPLLTTKKLHWNSIVTELLWFLKGDTNIKYLLDNNNTIWVGDAYKNYLKITKREIELNEAMKTHPHYCLSKEEFIDKIKTDDTFAKQWGDLGPIYGKQWRNWEGVSAGISIAGDMEWGDFNIEGNKYGIDQIANLISELKTNPDSRRLMVNAWNVDELDKMVLPPCHYGFQVYTRELSEYERGILYSKKMEGYIDTDDVKNSSHYDSMNIPTRAISLMWNQRSVDTFLGLPYNIASYGLLLEIIAKEVNMVPEDLIGNLGDCHIYNNHIEQAKEQITRIPYTLPTLKIKPTLFEFGKPDPNKLDLDYYSIHNFELENYQSHPAIKAPLNN